MASAQEVEAVVVGSGATELAEALAERGLSCTAFDEAPTGGPGDEAGLAAGFREVERLLGDGRPGPACVLADDGDLALAAALSAAKLGRPMIRARPAAGLASGLESDRARVIAELAGPPVAEAGAGVQALADAVAATIRS